MVPVFVIRIVSVGIGKMAFASTTLKTGVRDGLKRGWEGFLWMVKIHCPCILFYVSFRI